MQFIRGLIETILPPAPAVAEARGVHLQTLQRLSNPQCDVATQSYSLLPYQDTRVRAIIHAAKFHNCQHSTHLLARVLHQWLTLQPCRYAIVPIPQSRKRTRERGYKPLECIATIGCVDTTHTYHPDLLRKTHHTQPQVGLARIERLQNVTGSFSVNKKATAPTLPFLLFDDVFTTGSTLTEARRTLTAEFGNNITCLTLAR